MPRQVIGLSEMRPSDLPTLRELLRLPALQGAEVLAGRQGLDEPVRWVHVGEIPDIARYLRGQELVLSTGVGLHQPQERRRYLERLAECGVAGVCIELGRYLRRIPDDMLKLADRLELPLIAFAQPVRFVDITRDVHAVILQGEKQILRSLQQLAEDLRHLLGSPQAEADILALLSRWLGDAALFLPIGAEPIRSGPPERLGVLEARAAELLRSPQAVSAMPAETALFDGIAIASRLVLQQDGRSGLLAASCRPGEDIAAAMALELAAAALAQVPRTRGQGPLPPPDDDILLARLLKGEWATLPETSLERIGSSGRPPVRAMLFLLRLEGIPTLRLRPALGGAVQQRGMHGLAGRRGEDLALLVLDPPTRADLRQLSADIGRLGDTSRVFLGASGLVPWTDLPRALAEAHLALTAAIWSGGTTSPFYEELGALRMLGSLRADFDLRTCVEEEMGPLLAHDRRHGTELLRTLDILLRMDHKDAAAHELGIRRQTLYHRIDRIASLLGEDFLRPDRRFRLNLAMVASRLQDTQSTGRFVTESGEHM